MGFSYQRQQNEPIVPAELASPESSGSESSDDGERGNHRENPRYHDDDPRSGRVN